MSDRRFRTLQRNVTLYPLYQVLINFSFWLPVFFLYFSEHLPLARVLQLEAIFYAAVVLLEVPSGYLSDTVGRRTTLLISAGALIVSYALFFGGPGLTGQTFAVFVGGQVFLGAGISFRSGTDTALHFDTLSALGRPDEYAALEATAHRWALVARAASALVGGLAATWQLRLAYGLSAVGAVALLVVVWLLVEPSADDQTEAGASPRRGFLQQIGACVGQLRNRSLAWLLGFAVLMLVIIHVPHELYQPYIDLLLQKRDVGLPGTGTPLVTGTMTALIMLAASWATARSIRLRDRIGLAPTLLGTTLLQVVIMTAMGLLLHEAVLLLVLVRSVPMAIMLPPLRGAVTPQLPRSLRATYLSLQSLLGRLAFSGTLLLLAAGVSPGAPLDWPALSSMSLAGAGAGAAGLLVLGATARPCLATLRRPDPKTPT